MPDQIDAFLTTWTTAERVGDVTALDGLLSRDFRAVGPLGFVLTKDAWCGRHRDGHLVYDAFGVDQVQRTEHDRCAVIVARHSATGTYDGHPLPEALRTTLVIVDVADGPRLAAAQMSFIAGTPGAPPVPGQAR